MKFRHDITEGDEIPNRWFCHGKIKPFGKYSQAPVLDYWILKLPSWKWGELWWQRDNAFCWHQLALRSLSHGEFFMRGKWNAGRRIHFGFIWIPDWDTVERSCPGLR